MLRGTHQRRRLTRCSCGVLNDAKIILGPASNSEGFSSAVSRRAAKAFFRRYSRQNIKLGAGQCTRVCCQKVAAKRVFSQDETTGKGDALDKRTVSKAVTLFTAVKLQTASLGNSKMAVYRLTNQCKYFSAKDSIFSERNNRALWLNFPSLF